MLKYLLRICMFTISSSVIAGTAIPFKENNELSITLSKDNYSRLVIKDDKILEYFYPENTLQDRIEKDREGVYIMPLITPVTLFITTEKGHHFSVNINSEDGLGKTFEFIAKTPVIAKPIETRLPTTKTDSYQEAIVDFIQKMEKKEKIEGVSIKYPFNKFQRFGYLSIFKKEIWNGVTFQGEISEIYNNGKEPITLDPAFFNTPNTIGVKFSKNLLNPKEKVFLYRVLGASHG